MFAPPFGRASPSSGPLSIQQWLLRHAIVISALFAVVSTSSDICGANFGNKIHTIGPVDGDLWAITKDNWTVYKLSSCKVENDSLSRCMKVESPVSVDSKWPELAKSVKEAVNKTDYSFTIDYSTISLSFAANDTVLAIGYMHGASPKYFGFLFGANKPIPTYGLESPNEGTWISSDEEDKVYRIHGFGKERDQIMFKYLCEPAPSNECQVNIMPKDDSTKNICNVGTNASQVQFTTDKCDEMTFNVSRGVLYRNQFYLFGSDKVYIFLDKSDKTKLVELSYETFFPCKKPTTTMAPLTSSNQTSNPPNQTVSTHSSANKTTTQAPGSKFGLIVGLIILAIVIIVALICTYFYVTDKRFRAKEEALAAKKAGPPKASSPGGKPAKSSACASKAVDSKANDSKADSKRGNPKAAVRKAGSRVSSRNPNSTIPTADHKNGSSQNGAVKPNSPERKVTEADRERFRQRAREAYIRVHGRAPPEIEKSELERVKPMPTPTDLTKELPSVTPDPSAVWLQKGKSNARLH